MIKNLSICIGLLILLLGSAAFATADITIGINAPRGELKALKRFGPIATYLEEELGEKVILVPKKVTALMDFMEADPVDFVLANPVQTIIMQKDNGIIPLATMNRMSGPYFAGVIIARKDSGLTTVEDLRGKKVMSLTPLAAAAYVFQTYHMIQQGVDPRKDCAVFVQGKKLDDLVLAVQAGVMDAAFIKSGILELMAKEGSISMDNFTIIDEQLDSDFPQRHTTQIYPSWFFSAAKKTTEEQRAKVREALLKLPASHPASKNAKIKGFVEALPLHDLDQALKTLKLRPYEQ